MCVRYKWSRHAGHPGHPGHADTPTRPHAPPSSCKRAPPGGRSDVAIDLLANDYRGDFPILDQKVNGYPLVYLDNAASTQHPACVIDEIDRYYRQEHAKIHL